jgi:hypothetical protein
MQNRFHFFFAFLKKYSYSLMELSGRQNARRLHHRPSIHSNACPSPYWNFLSPPALPRQRHPLAIHPATGCYNWEFTPTFKAFSQFVLL